MADITPELILCRLKGIWSNMADRLEDLVYTDDSKEMIDIINVLLIGWILLGLIVYIVGNIIANQLHKYKKGEKAKETPEPKDSAIEVSSAKPPLPSDSLVNHKANILKDEHKSTIEQTEKTSTAFPSAEGSDPDAVHWTNDLLEWVQLPSSTPFLIQAWIRCLNEKIKKQVSLICLHLMMNSVFNILIFILSIFHHARLNFFKNIDLSDYFFIL
ncbi:uncharacterized protein LOC111629245 [Centruroides sculpturatus]|uniref:uncharacterized protein LOC111629245 n=1 Tax=Centruroides sculpturatus TaxID=218467 RepID=UPI000C6DEDE3|nr:uncharacterized protein LOC111629245 [Centruroides sculpturatus]